VPGSWQVAVAGNSVPDAGIAPAFGGRQEGEDKEISCQKPLLRIYG